MQSKEGIIKEAWGAFNGPSTFEENKSFIDENGYMTLWNFLRNIGNIRKGLQRKKGISDDFIRPKSLQGIENNNNWINIESEVDLPNDGYVFWIMRKGIDFPLYRYVDHFSIQEKLYWMESYTHYQPIKKPKLPIF